MMLLLQVGIIKKSAKNALENVEKWMAPKEVNYL